MYSPHECRVAVPQGVRGDPAYKVQVTVTLCIEEPASLTPSWRYPQPFVGLHHCLHAATPSDMRVPTRSPATAASSAPFLLPLRILASTPPRAASAAARSLGTIPPAATESALTLYAPFGPSPSGATTGTNPPVHRASMSCGTTRTTLPTRPRSGIGSTSSVGPSVPEMPAAWTPRSPSPRTRPLFTPPANTFSATSIVSSSVTLSPA